MRHISGQTFRINAPFPIVHRWPIDHAPLPYIAWMAKLDRWVCPGMMTAETSDIGGNGLIPSFFEIRYYSKRCHTSRRP
eukprot:6212923-Pleurochrysis_carterae.AAC.2